MKHQIMSTSFFWRILLEYKHIPNLENTTDKILHFLVALLPLLTLRPSPLASPPLHLSSPLAPSSHPSHLAASPADETPLIRPDLLISRLMSALTRDRQAD